MVINFIIYGYENREDGIIWIEVYIYDNEVIIVIIDKGIGIEDIGKVMELLYILRFDLERLGMGFIVMEIFMDKLSVESEKGVGIKVVIKKKFNVVS